MLPDDHHCGQGVSLSRSVPTDELAVFEYQADAVKVYVVMVCFFVVHIIVLLNDVCGAPRLKQQKSLAGKAGSLVERGMEDCESRKEGNMPWNLSTKTHSTPYTINISVTSHLFSNILL